MPNVANVLREETQRLVKGQVKGGLSPLNTPAASETPSVPDDKLHPMRETKVARFAA